MALGIITGFNESRAQIKRMLNMFKKMVLVFVFFLSLTLAAFADVNINKADEATLISLSGIGPVKAAAIVEYRKNNG